MPPSGRAIMKKPPEIDEADVDRMINFMFGRSINTDITQEERAEVAYQVALGISKVQGRSTAFAEAFAKRVRDRAMWLKAPTGQVQDFPE
jgi:hypothetical protein